MAVLLSDLNRRKKKWLVFVKVLSIWNNPPKHPNDQTTMILVDETGQRIDATVPTIAIKRNFPRELREGQWYLFSEFDVIPPSLPERNSIIFTGLAVIGTQRWILSDQNHNPNFLIV
ncbi:unnamed protein product [Arabidopsis halleri]